MNSSSTRHSAPISLAPVISPGQTSVGATQTTAETSEGISEWEAGVSLAKAIMGAGSFALPWAFSKMGYVAGPLVLVVFLGLSVRSIGLLVECARGLRLRTRRQRQQQQQQQLGGASTGKPSVSYVDVARSVFGPTGAALAYGASIASSIGVCGSYLVFVAVNLAALLDGASSPGRARGGGEDEDDDDDRRRRFLLLVWAVALPIAVLLSSVRNPKRFAEVSFWGDLSVMAGMLAVVVYGLVFRDDDVAAAKDCVAVGSPGDMALALGSIGYLFLVHFLVLPIESSMAGVDGGGERIPTDTEAATTAVAFAAGPGRGGTQPDRFQRVVMRTFVVCGCIGGVFGIIGYFMFGSDTQQIVLLNVEGSIGMAIVQSLLCMDLLLTYPVVMRPSIRILEEHWMTTLLRSRHPKRSNSLELDELVSTSVSATSAAVSSSASCGKRAVSVSGGVEAKPVPNPTEHVSLHPIYHDDDDDDDDHESKPMALGGAQHMAVCIGLGVVAAGAGSFVPAFGLLSGLVGGVSQTFLAFVLPPLMWAKQQQQQQQSQQQHEEHNGLLPLSSMNEGTRSTGNDPTVWACFQSLPLREKALVLCGVGLIGWTLQSTWAELGNGVGVD